MNIEQLRHICRAVHNITGESEFDIFGSQSILGHTDRLNVPCSMTSSTELDIACTSNIDKYADAISGAIGQDTHFDNSFGICADGIRPEEISLPSGYRSRMRTQVLDLQDESHTMVLLHFLSLEDTIASKLCALRHKDYYYISKAKQANIVDEDLLGQCIDELNSPHDLMAIYRNL